MGNKRTLEILGDGQILHQSRSKHIYNWLTATFFPLVKADNKYVFTGCLC